MEPAKPEPEVGDIKEFLYDVTWNMNMDCLKENMQYPEFNENDLVISDNLIKVVRRDLPCGEKLCKSCVQVLRESQENFNTKYQDYINRNNVPKKRYITKKKVIKY
jgi:hypothetical protein